MFRKTNYSENLNESYQLLLKQLTSLIEGESDQIANLANAAALLNQFLTDINWVGFYLYKDNELVLGPFQGLPACIRIPIGKGVCGYCAKTKKTVIVPNVHEFTGHIACDVNTNSEIVVPMIDKDNMLIGVLDIDSPKLNRFSNIDQKNLKIFIKILIKQL